jgi:hypothetical protein
MGLLDDAIRQHLEFKRLRGADPSEVAREELDALGPAVRERNMASQVHLGAPKDSSSRYAEDDPLDGPPPIPGPHVDQETAELDMRTVLDAEPMEFAVHRVPTSMSSSPDLGTVA